MRKRSPPLRPACWSCLLRITTSIYCPSWWTRAYPAVPDRQDGFVVVTHPQGTHPRLVDVRRDAAGHAAKELLGLAHGLLLPLPLLHQGIDDGPLLLLAQMHHRAAGVIFYTPDFHISGVVDVVAMERFRDGALLVEAAGRPGLVGRNMTAMLLNGRTDVDYASYCAACKNAIDAAASQRPLHRSGRRREGRCDREDRPTSVSPACSPRSSCPASRKSACAVSVLNGRTDVDYASYCAACKNAIDINDPEKALFLLHWFSQVSMCSVRAELPPPEIPLSTSSDSIWKS